MRRIVRIPKRAAKPTYTSGGPSSISRVTATMLGDIMQAYNHSVVWVTLINNGYIDFLINFVESMRQCNIQWKLIVFCLDKEAYSAASNLQKCIAVPYYINSINGLQTFGTASYKTIVFNKLDCIKEAIQSGKASGITYVGYIDTDIWLYSDPTPIIINSFAENSVLCVCQCDESGTTCTNRSKCGNLCSGVIVFNTETRLDIFNYTDSDVRNFQSDQVFLASKMHGANVPYRTVDRAMFVNGGWPNIFNNYPSALPESAALLHFNYLVGNEKIKTMKRCNKWTVCDYYIPPVNAGFFFNLTIFLTYNMTYSVYPLWTRAAGVASNTSLTHFGYFTADSDENVFQRHFTHTGGTMSRTTKAINRVTLPDVLTNPTKRSAMMHDSSAFAEWRRKLHSVFISRLTIHPHIVKKVYDKYKDLSGHIIGVHYRNPVHMCESGTVLFEDYMTAIEKVKSPTSIVLLATDCEFAYLKFKDAYGESLIHFPEHNRISLDSTIQWIQELRKNKEDATGLIKGIGYEVHNSGSSKGIDEEALIEALCLCRADIVIGAPSNVMLAVGYINPDLQMVLL